jgi:hypothetical protein
VRKPIEVESSMVAARATPEDIKDVRRVLDEGIRERHPGYSFYSECICTVNAGRLMRVARTYQYSRWEALKCRFFSLFSSSKAPQEN